MEISRNNYEIFFLDYLDGKLEGKEIDRFLDFIEQNPDLKEELKGIEKLQLPAGPVTFRDKKTLYKTEKQKIHAENFTAVAYMEGDLSPLETELFLKHLEFHPEQAKDMELLMKTRLQADETIVFPAKNKLYRQTPIQKLIYWGTRVAAILLLAFAFWTVFNFNKDKDIINNTEVLAEKNKIPVNQSKEIQPEKQKKQELNSSEKAENRPLETEGHERLIAKNIAIPAPVEPSSRRTRSQVGLLQPLAARLIPVETDQQMELTDMQLKQKNKETDNYYSLDRFVTEKMLKIKKSDKSLIESGLDLAGNVSKNRISYETDEGKVSKIKFESRLLAFSVPVKRAK